MRTVILSIALIFLLARPSLSSAFDLRVRFGAEDAEEISYTGKVKQVLSRDEKARTAVIKILDDTGQTINLTFTTTDSAFVKGVIPKITANDRVEFTVLTPKLPDSFSPKENEPKSVGNILVIGDEAGIKWLFGSTSENTLIHGDLGFEFEFRCDSQKTGMYAPYNVKVSQKGEKIGVFCPDEIARISLGKKNFQFVNMHSGKTASVGKLSLTTTKSNLAVFLLR